MLDVRVMWGRDRHFRPWLPICRHPVTARFELRPDPSAHDSRVRAGHRHSTLDTACGNTWGYTLGMAKVMVSLADDLLAEIDAEAERRSTSRSALLAAAARRELTRRDNDLVAAAIERSEQRFSRSGRFESADLVRADRDSRR